MTEISKQTWTRLDVFRGRTLPATTLSIGLAALSDTVAESQTLITAADKAMYAAKRMGRNRIECFAASPASSIARLAVEG